MHLCMAEQAIVVPLQQLGIVEGLVALHKTATLMVERAVMVRRTLASQEPIYLWILAAVAVAMVQAAEEDGHIPHSTITVRLQARTVGRMVRLTGLTMSLLPVVRLALLSQ